VSDVTNYRHKRRYPPEKRGPVQRRPPVLVQPTSVCALKLLLNAALSYYCMRPVCALKLLVQRRPPVLVQPTSVCALSY
jgi:hypothetical protein